MASNAINKKGLTIKAQLRSDWPVLLLLASSLIAAFIIHPHLPEKVPSHWNLHGEVDGYSSRFWGAFGIPLLNVAMYFLMLVLPLIDPRRDSYKLFAGSYQILKIAIIAVLTGLYAVIILSALGYDISINKVVPMGISLLIIVIGNVMGRFRHNYFVGIKVPWTLASEEVWQKTHRFAAPLWVIAGILGFTGSMAGGLWAAVLLFVPLAVAVIVPVIYSFLLYQKLKHN